MKKFSYNLFQDNSIFFQFAVAKFVLRRSRKDLNTINKAVVHGR